MTYGSPPAAAAVAPSGPSLLVPIRVKVLLQTTLSERATWADSTPSYGQLSLFSNVAATPFASSSAIAGQIGAVVSWSLPPSLTQGGTSGRGSSYPAVPNRWLVLRSALMPPATTPTLTAWVVESDFIDPNLGTTEYPQFQGQGADAVLAATSIGRVVSLGQWPDANTQSAMQPPLQAVGAGDVTFAAYAPGALGVFAMSDPLADVLNPASLTYGVAGWYSDPSLDPLAGAPTTAEAWADLAASLGWSVGDITEANQAAATAAAWAVEHGLAPAGTARLFPRRIVCHGMSFAAGWPGPNGVLQTGVPDDPNNVIIAVGNTTAEALATLIAYQIDGPPKPPSPGPPSHGQQIATLVEAFQYNLLDALDGVDGTPALSQAMHDGSFASLPGGTVWQVVMSSGAAASLSSDLGQALAILNTAQWALDQAAQQLGSAQVELYTAWWRCQKWTMVPPTPPQPGTSQQAQDYYNAQLVVVSQLQAVQQAAAAHQATALAAVRAAILAQTEGSGTYLDSATGDTRAVGVTLDDTAMAITGTDGAPLARWDYAALVRLTTPDHRLRLARAGDLSTWLEVDDPAFASAIIQCLSLKTRPADRMVLKQRTAAPFRAPLDPVILVAGAGLSSTLDANGPTGDTGLLFCRFSGQTVGALKVAMSNGTSVTVDGSALVATLPGNANAPLDIADLAAEQFILDTSLSAAIAAQASKRAGGAACDAVTIARQQTVQWNAQWTPTSPLDQQSVAEQAGLLGMVPCRIAVDPWVPPWAPLYLDWEVTWFQSDAADWEFDGEDFTYSGEVPTAEGIALQARSLLTPMAATHLYANMETYAGQHPASGNAQELADMLKKIADADLLSQRLSGFGPALQTLAINQPTFLPSGLAPQFGSNPGILPYDAGFDFLPLRHGHFLIQKLWVVDAFGQAFAIYDNGSSEAYPAPNFAPSIAGNYGLGRYGRLPPRLVQPSRLAFDLVDADDPSRVVGSDPRANPVCGWLLPNHLNQSITVYDADGTCAGELALGDKTLSWWPAPDSGAVLGAPPAIANPTLLAVIATYLRRPDGAAAYATLLHAIDETMSNFSPIDTGGITAMAAAIGNPVAVVRARVALEFRGLPAVSQLAQDVGSGNTGDVFGFSVPVKLGSLELAKDGLLGYFLNGDFTTLLTPAPPPQGNASATDFSLSYAAGHNSAELLLLMDPRGVVHAATGLLPVGVQSLPAGAADAPLRRMAVTFEVGPVVTDPATITLPLPALGKGTWTWLDRPDVASWSGDQAIVAADGSARLPETPPVVAEGWLKLSNAEDTD